MISSSSENPKKVRFLVLGDSYSIGEGVPEKDRWPEQLASSANRDYQFDITYVAKTGWTTDELTEAIASARLKGSYDLVSLLIGVNNQYRGYEIAQYEKEFQELLKQAIAFAGEDPQKVFVLSIPDYGVTPFVKEQNLDGLRIGRELNQYNDIAAQYCEKMGVVFFDITKISGEAAAHTSLIAADGLHPSAEMYQKWVEIVTPRISKSLK